jgi:PAS domain-containing protein
MGVVAACAAYALAQAARRARLLRTAWQAEQPGVTQTSNVLESMSAIVCRCDGSGAILEASGAFAALAHSDADAMRGKTLPSVFECADELSDLDGLIRAAFSGNAATGLTCELDTDHRGGPECFTRRGWGHRISPLLRLGCN